MKYMPLFPASVRMNFSDKKTKITTKAASHKLKDIMANKTATAIINEENICGRLCVIICRS